MSTSTIPNKLLFFSDFCLSHMFAYAYILDFFVYELHLIPSDGMISGHNEGDFI